MNKKAHQSKTIWFHAITMILTIAGIWNLEFVKDFLDTPEKQLMAATLLQGVVGILLRYATSSGLKVPKIPGINSIFIAMLVCLPLVAITSCKSDDFKKIENVWSFVMPTLTATTEIAADWCADGTVTSIVPDAAQACDHLIETKQDGLDAIIGVDKLVKGVIGVAIHFTKENQPTQAQRVQAIQNAFHRMPVELQRDIIIAINRGSPILRIEHTKGFHVDGFNTARYSP